jgi:exodeoxyribonuclease VII large subunit
MSPADDLPAPPTDNAPAWSVSELSFALKRTLEEAYGFVRLRGELSKVTHHSNGHVYLTIKDDKAAIDGVIWKGNVRGLAVRPEQGLEVIVTGKITTYPAGSRYQIVIDSLEPAGIGALLAQLERLKAKLSAEGLFDPAHRKPLPSMPSVIGVITSPTGAVIRDILHRIRDRWPAHVIVWPVVVQGESACGQINTAIAGFHAYPVRPDVIIIARGGGSVEDLWCFNHEDMARAVFASEIPIISAVGHETDTTLIDFVADRRAPTPTAAAEMATPVLAELRAALADHQRRLFRLGGRLVEDRRQRLGSARLPRKEDLLALPSQRFDLAARRLDAGLQRNVAVHEQAFARVSSPLKPGILLRHHQTETERLNRVAARLAPAAERRLERARDRLSSLAKLHQSLNPDAPLNRGFARVERADGSLARSAKTLAAGEAVSLVFADGRRGAVVDGAARAPVAKGKSAGLDQGDLF